MSQMTPVIGFAPDADPRTPGVLTACNGLLPTERGMQTIDGVTANSFSTTLPSASRGGSMVTGLSGARTLYAGTASRLYRHDGTTWNDISAASASLGANDLWSFAQFGNDTIAAAITETLQKATTGSFAAIAGAPKAQIALSLGGFVVLLHTNEGTFGDQADRWWCSAFQNDTDWVPAVSTQCTTGRLVEGEGPITAGAVLGNDFIVAKRRALFRARYVGPPTVWQFTKIAGERGCISQNAMVSLGNELLIVSDDDIYIFDGSQAKSIAEGTVRKYFVSKLDLANKHKTYAIYDSSNKRAWIFYVSVGGTLQLVLVYDALTGRWGQDSGLANNYESALLVDSFERRVPAFFNSSHQIRLFSQPGVSSLGTNFTANQVGEEDSYTHLSKVHIRFTKNPSSATASVYGTDTSGATPVFKETFTLDDGSVDLRQSARWHNVVVNITGSAEVSHIGYELKREGRR